MNGMELICFQIISAVGSAKSNYIEAISEVKKGNTEKANALMEEGKQVFIKGHEAHAGLIQQEACGESVQFSLLLMHAEDQLMAAETTRLLAEELIEVHTKLMSL